MAETKKEVDFASFGKRDFPETGPPPMYDSYYVRFLRNAKSEEDVKWFMEKLATILRADRPFLVLYDASFVSSAKKKHLQTLAAFLKKNKDVIKNLTIACCVVIPDMLVRGTVELVLFVDPVKYPLKVVAKEEDAKEFMRQQEAAYLKKKA